MLRNIRNFTSECECECQDLNLKISSAKKELGELSESIAKETEALLKIQALISRAELENEKLKNNIKTPKASESDFEKDMVILKDSKENEHNISAASEDFDDLRLSEELLKMRNTAKNVLVENWKMPFVENIDRIDLDISSNFESRKCESNPELNPYIRIPKFSRNRWDYNVSRKRI